MVQAIHARRGLFFSIEGADHNLPVAGHAGRVGRCAARARPLQGLSSSAALPIRDRIGRRASLLNVLRLRKRERCCTASSLGELYLLTLRCGCWHALCSCTSSVP